MNNNKNDNLEKVLSKALDLLQEGKSSSQILNLFAEYKTELQEIFQVIEVLSSQKNRIIPPKELLTKIIAQIKIEEDVTYFRGEIKGRPSIGQLFNVIKFSDMIKKSYIAVGIIALILLVVGGGIYWQSQKKVAISPIELEVFYEDEILSQDIAELENFIQDVSLDNLDEDLANIVEEKVVVETASIENLENEITLELNSLSNDLSDLEGFESDISLNDLDSLLFQVAE